MLGPSFTVFGSAMGAAENVELDSVVYPALNLDGALTSIPRHRQRRESRCLSALRVLAMERLAAVKARSDVVGLADRTNGGRMSGEEPRHSDEDVFAEQARH